MRSFIQGHQFYLKSGIARRAAFVTLISLLGMAIASASGARASTHKPKWIDQYPATLCRAASRYAFMNGYRSGFPTYEYRNYNDTKVLFSGVHWGVIEFPPNMAIWHDISQDDLVGSDRFGNPNPIPTFDALLRAVSAYAFRHGYAGGVPTCETVEVNGTRVWGAVFFETQAVEVTSVGQNDLQRTSHIRLNYYDTSVPRRERAVNRYADTFKTRVPSFACGIPTWDDYDKVTGSYPNEVHHYVFGLVKFRLGAVAWEDVPAHPYIDMDPSARRYFLDFPSGPPPDENPSVSIDGTGDSTNNGVPSD